MRFTACLTTMQFQADEAQHRHYNDGYNRYATPSPYDSPFDPPQTHGSVLPDPFAAPPQRGSYVDPTMTHDAYGAPLPSRTPPQPTNDYFTQQYNPSFNAYPTATPSPPRAAHRRPSYELQDENVEDAGEIPLLRRDNSQGTTYSMPQAPGGYEEATSDDKSESNIRYGRIPQRVPRRYKTIKRVECVHVLRTDGR